MESEILSTLNDIKLAVYILLGVVIIGVLANWVRIVISIKNTIREQLNDIFSEEASNYCDEGKFDELLDHCEGKLKNKPNHTYALWYKAKALYYNREYEESKKCFNRLAILEPGWLDLHIKPYVEAMVNNEGNIKYDV